MNRRLWYYRDRPKMFQLNSWEKRNWSNPRDEEVQMPKVKTADELFNESINFAKQNTPLAYGARESALSDVSKGNAYYEGFQPTSFEQALGNQYFQNVMPDVERSIKQNLSLSGMAYSPILSSQIATQRGNLGVSIGEYLSNLANQRAGYSLSSRLGIPPQSTYEDFLNTNLGQSNLQSSIDFQNALSRYNYGQEQKGGMASTIGSIGGGILGAVAAPFTGGLVNPITGAAIGSSLGGTVGSLWGSGGKPMVSMGDALNVYSSFNKPKSTLEQLMEMLNQDKFNKAIATPTY